MNTRKLQRVCLLIAVSFFTVTASAQSKITTPKEQLGFNFGDDYQLANYTQLVNYWKKLAQQSDRMKLVEIGKTAEGRTMVMAIITAPENHKKLDRYKEIARRLATAEGLTDDQARALAAEGKAVVWIDGGLHATEVLGAQQLLELVYQMVSMNDPETLRILKDVILLATPVNPDGLELVSNWYMREQDPLKRSTAGLPRLYQKYIGHDNNRDFYMSNQPETEAINRVFFHDWFPQIVYNHHQTGPAGTVLFAPPFRDPFNYYLDPLVPLGIDLVGAAMHSRFVAENKPGATMRSGSSYSTWWNGGLRTVTYFHNMIGLLTESIGNPTPIEIPFLLQRQLAKGDFPYPVAPQKWRFRQSIDYSITANRAVLDLASKHREDFLFNIYRMGKNSIERGSRDHWTITPKRIAEVQAAITKEMPQPQAAGAEGQGRRAAAAAGDAAPAGDAPQGFGGQARGVPLKYYEMLRTPDKRDPRGFIIPSDQPDFLTAAKFINTLIKTGITIHRAASEFTVAGKSYPAGSYVVKTAQAFRPHILDMFEPQDHPDDIPYPGGPPTPPYDNAGYTVAYQMGVTFDRVLEGFEGPFEKINGLVKPAAGKVNAVANAAGFLLSHQVNDSIIAVNRLLASGEEVYWLKQPLSANGKNYGVGAIFIPAKSSTLPRLQKLADDVGLSFDAVASKPTGEAYKLRALRIGLWDRYGGSMPSGWVRWLLEQYEFPFTVVYPPALDAGDLASKFDVLIFVDGGIPARDGGGPGGRGGGGGGLGGTPDPMSIPAEFRERLGNVTVARTVPQLRQFLEAGGAILTIGSSTSLGYSAGLPIANALMERTQDGSERPLQREKYYIPGSILQARIDNSNPLAYGMGDKLDVFFDNSPVFRLRPDAAMKGVKPVAWFDSDKPLRSGWAWGQKYLQDGVAVAEARVGKGKLFLFGPEITFRGQPHGTFKFLFNGIYYGGAESVTLK
jgi:hypothetical protein